jgi:hypothetical protein
MEIDKWIAGYKVRSFPWIDGKRIYFNVQYFQSGQSIHQPPVWDKTVYVNDDEHGRKMVDTFTHTLVEYVSRMKIKEDTEVTLFPKLSEFQLSV